MSHDDVIWTRWQEVDRIFELALERPESERLAAAREACGDDEQLYRVVCDLLDITESEDSRLTGPGAELLSEVLPSGDESGSATLDSGEIVGRYRIVGELGRGGMATVYEAERSDGVYQQTVALKVLRRGLDTDRIVERFLAERQILSNFAHPNVARLLDGGATPDGRPFLVMEKVDGEPLTRWAQTRDLPTRDRLALFLQVTDAVREAHRRLVVHRDLKPDNILVNASGQVKLLDFGIAKLLGPGAAEHVTELGTYPLTRRYASPEQLRGEPVTTSSDIYQLGLILHELITGAWPLDQATGEVTTDLSGDMGVIVRKALAAEAEDRFQSVDGLAADVRRHLAGRPIAARPAPAWLRARKWIGRNRWAAPVAGVLLLGAAGYVGTLMVNADRLERERNEARAHAARAERIKSLLVELFRSTDPFNPQVVEARHDLTVAEALAPAVDRIRTDLRDDPLAQLDLLSAVASVLYNIGRGAEGRPLIDEALAVRRQIGQDSTPAFASDLLTLSAMLRHEDWDSAAVLARRAIETLRGTVADDDPRLASALAELMWVQLTRLPPADAALGEEALAIYRRAGRGHHEATAGVLGHLSYVYASAGRLDDAEAAARRALRLTKEARGDDDVRTALAAVQLASALDARHRFEEAIPLYVDAISVLEATAGPEHGQTLSTKNNLATTYQSMGRTAEAVAMHRDLLATRIRAAGTESRRDVAASMQNLATALKDSGELREADSLAARAHQLFVETTADGHPSRAYPLLTRAAILLDLDDAATAEAVSARALEILSAALPEGHYATGVARCRLGAALLRQGRTLEASPNVRAALEALTADDRTPPAYLEECARVGAELDAPEG